MNNKISLRDMQKQKSIQEKKGKICEHMQQSQQMTALNYYTCLKKLIKA